MSLHTLINMENGRSYTFENLIRVLRSLHLINNINELVPKVLINPDDVISKKGEPKRVRRSRE